MRCIIATDLSIYKPEFYKKVSRLRMSIKRWAVAMLLFAWVGVVASAQVLDARPFYSTGNHRDILSANFTKAEVDSMVSLVATGQKIQIVGLSSPDGDQAKNYQLSERRAKSILRQLKKKTNLADSVFELHAKVLTWRDLYNHVLGDTLVPDRQDVMNLLDSADGRNGREVMRQLRRLSRGVPYLYIKSHLLPLMRTTLVSVGEAKPEYDVGQSARVGEQRHVARYFVPRQAKTQSKEVSKKALSSQKASLDSLAAVSADTLISHAKKDTMSQQAAPPVSIIEKPVATRGYWIAIALLLAVLMGVLCFGIILLRRKDHELSQAKQLVMIKEQRIRELEGQQAANVRLIGSGEQLYQDIQHGGSAVKWSNKQTKEFFDYYSLVNPLMMDNIEQQYGELPPSNIMYLILLDMGKTDAEIQQIMGISQTTIRSIRFRIKSRLKK